MATANGNEERPTGENREEPADVLLSMTILNPDGTVYKTGAQLAAEAGLSTDPYQGTAPGTGDEEDDEEWDYGGVGLDEEGNPEGQDDEIVGVATGELYDGPPMDFLKPAPPQYYVLEE